MDTLYRKQSVNQKSNDVTSDKLKRLTVITVLGDMTEALAFRRGIFCLLAMLAGALITIWCFYPGYMSVDSFEQLKQARSGKFTDWHPPLMSYTWGLFDQVMPGPSGMLIFHSLMFWIGLALVVYLSVANEYLAPLLILSIGFFPPIFAVLGTVWKDVGMAASLLLAFALLLYAERNSNKPALLAALLCLFYGLSVRHNSAPAVFPLALWSGLIAYRLWDCKKSRATLLMVGLGIGIFLFLGLLSFGATRLLTKGQSAYPIQAILLHDLVGVSIRDDSVYLPDYVMRDNPSITVKALKQIYTPSGVVPLFCWPEVGCDNTVYRLKFTRNEEDIAALKAKWLSIVPHHLGLYWAHRLAVFKAQFGIQQDFICYPFHTGIIDNSFGMLFPETALNNWVRKILDKLKESILFRGWPYLIVLGLLLNAVRSLARVRATAVAAFVLGLSGLLYALAYLPIATTCDFRMHWWTVVATVILPCVLFGRNNLTEYRNSAHDAHTNYFSKN